MQIARFKYLFRIMYAFKAQYNNRVWNRTLVLSLLLYLPVLISFGTNIECSFYV